MDEREALDLIPNTYTSSTCTHVCLSDRETETDIYLIVRKYSGVLEGSSFWTHTAELSDSKSMRRQEACGSVCWSAEGKKHGD